MRSESHALQCLQSTCGAAIHNGVWPGFGFWFLLDGSIEQKWVCSFVWGNAHKHNARFVFPWKNLKHHFFQQSRTLLFLSPACFLATCRYYMSPWLTKILFSLPHAQRGSCARGKRGNSVSGFGSAHPPVSSARWVLPLPMSWSSSSRPLNVLQDQR